MAGLGRVAGQDRLLDDLESAKVVQPLGEGGGIAPPGGPAQLVESGRPLQQAANQVQRPFGLQKVDCLMDGTLVCLLRHRLDDTTAPLRPCFSSDTRERGFGDRKSTRLNSS